MNPSYTGISNNQGYVSTANDSYTNLGPGIPIQDINQNTLPGIPQIQNPDNIYQKSNHPGRMNQPNNYQNFQTKYKSKWTTK